LAREAADTRAAFEARGWPWSYVKRGRWRTNRTSTAERLPQNDRALLFRPSQRIACVHECLCVAWTPVHANDDAGVCPVRYDLRLNHVIVALDAPEETRTVVGGERHGCSATGSDRHCNP
jgi:hypothetical protein